MEQSIKVEFIEQLEQEKVVREIGDIQDPHIFLWYIGPYGLKKLCVDFYRDVLIDPIISQNKNSLFILVDLTAWGALKSPNLSLSHFSSHVNSINAFNLSQIRCIKSSDTFERIKSIQNSKIVGYFQIALDRSFIQKQSVGAQLTGFTIGSLFSEDCPIIERWMNVDASKCYSLLQYLEAFILIEDVLQNSLKQSVNIAFALPNDELKYYQDESDAFQEDLQFFLKYRKISLLNRKVKVSFYSFPFGKKQSDRPYNIPGQVVKNGRLSQEQLISSVQVI